MSVCDNCSKQCQNARLLSCRHVLCYPCSALNTGTSTNNESQNKCIVCSRPHTVLRTSLGKRSLQTAPWPIDIDSHANGTIVKTNSLITPDADISISSRNTSSRIHKGKQPVKQIKTKSTIEVPPVGQYLAQTSSSTVRSRPNSNKNIVTPSTATSSNITSTMNHHQINRNLKQNQTNNNIINTTQDAGNTLTPKTKLKGNPNVQLKSNIISNSPLPQQPPLKLQRLNSQSQLHPPQPPPKPAVKTGKSLQHLSLPSPRSQIHLNTTRSLPQQESLLGLPTPSQLSYCSPGTISKTSKRDSSSAATLPVYKPYVKFPPALKTPSTSVKTPIQTKSSYVKAENELVNSSSSNIAILSPNPPKLSTTPRSNSNNGVLKPIIKIQPKEIIIQNHNTLQSQLQQKPQLQNTTFQNQHRQQRNQNMREAHAQHLQKKQAGQQHLIQNHLNSEQQEQLVNPKVDVVKQSSYTQHQKSPARQALQKSGLLKQQQPTQSIIQPLNGKATNQPKLKKRVRFGITPEQYQDIRQQHNQHQHIPKKQQIQKQSRQRQLQQPKQATQNEGHLNVLKVEQEGKKEQSNFLVKLPKEETHLEVNVIPKKLQLPPKQQQNQLIGKIVQVQVIAPQQKPQQQEIQPMQTQTKTKQQQPQQQPQKNKLESQNVKVQMKNANEKRTQHQIKQQVLQSLFGNKPPERIQQIKGENELAPQLQYHQPQQHKVQKLEQELDSQPKLPQEQFQQQPLLYSPMLYTETTAGNKKQQKIHKQKLQELQPVRELQRLEQQKLEQQKSERRRFEQQILKQQRLKQQLLEQQKLEQEMLGQHRLEQQRLEQQKLEQKKLEPHKLHLLELKKQQQQELEQKKLEHQKIQQQKHQYDRFQGLESQKLKAQKSQQQGQKRPKKQLQRRGGNQQRLDDSDTGVASVLGPTALDEVRCELKPESSAPKLPRSAMRTTGKLTIALLRKFLHTRLNLTSESKVHLRCAGEDLIDAMTLAQLDAHASQSFHYDVSSIRQDNVNNDTTNKFDHIILHYRIVKGEHGDEIN